MAKLKVFAWSNGLKTYAVATTSRPKALAAWGIHQDLFADGTAHETDDPDLVAATTAQPGVVVEQAVSGGAAKAIAAVKPPPRPKPTPTAAQKRAAELKARRAALDDEHVQALRDIDRRRSALDDEAAALDDAYDAARAALANKLKTLTGDDA